MKFLISMIAGLVVNATTAYAAPEDFIGTFKGTEKSTLTNCGAYNGTSTGSWFVKHSDLKDNQFVGAGSNKDGDFTVTGEASDTTAFGVAKGVNKYGLAWKAEFKATLESNKFTSTTMGSVSSGCKFTSEVEATKR
ncbi:MAG: hypothetical protein H7Z70_02080 [Bacteroidia bacterium]|nr:hypothetical protein [Methylotenera sp.]